MSIFESIYKLKIMWSYEKPVPIHLVILMYKNYGSANFQMLATNVSYHT